MWLALDGELQQFSITHAPPSLELKTVAAQGLKEPAGHHTRLDDNPAAARALRIVANALDQFSWHARVLPFRIDAEQANSQPIEPVRANADRPDHTLGDAAHPGPIAGVVTRRLSTILFRRGRLGLAQLVRPVLDARSSPPFAVV
jgi:hypothetical protein